MGNTGVLNVYINTRTVEKDYDWYRLDRGNGIALCAREDQWPEAYAHGLKAFLPSDHRAAVLYRRREGGSMLGGIFWGPTFSHETDHVSRNIDYLLLLEFVKVDEAATFFCGLVREWWQSGAMGVASLAARIQRAARLAPGRGEAPLSPGSARYTAACGAVKDLLKFLDDQDRKWVGAGQYSQECTGNDKIAQAMPMATKLNGKRIDELLSYLVSEPFRELRPYTAISSLSIDAALVKLSESLERIDKIKPVEINTLSAAWRVLSEMAPDDWEPLLPQATWSRPPEQFQHLKRSTSWIETIKALVARLVDNLPSRGPSYGDLHRARRWAKGLGGEGYRECRSQLTDLARRNSSAAIVGVLEVMNSSELSSIGRLRGLNLLEQMGQDAEEAIGALEHLAAYADSEEIRDRARIAMQKINCARSNDKRG